MRRIKIDASALLEEEDPIRTLRNLFNLTGSIFSLDDLRRNLIKSSDPVIVEFYNTDSSSLEWLNLEEIFEEVQQKNSDFYVIWGPEARQDFQGPYNIINT